MFKSQGGSFKVARRVIGIFLLGLLGSIIGSRIDAIGYRLWVKPL